MITFKTAHQPKKYGRSSFSIPDFSTEALETQDGLLPISLQRILTNLVFQLGHIVSKSLAQILHVYSTIIAKWEKDLWQLSHFREIGQREFWQFSSDVQIWYLTKSNQAKPLKKKTSQAELLARYSKHRLKCVPHSTPPKIHQIERVILFVLLCL